MILTGKCKEHFYEWLYENEEILFVDESMEMYNNILIINWFDQLETLNRRRRGMIKFRQLYLSSMKEMHLHHSILSINKKVIERANEIYNS